MLDQQPRALKRHTQILDAALRVFARKGYLASAVDDIANESSTSKGGVYFHFPGKQAIFLALLERSAERLKSKIREATAANSRPIERADAAMLAVLRSFAGHRSMARLFMIEAYGADREFHKRLAQIQADFSGLIQAELDEAVEQGVIEPLDTTIASTAWLGALNQIITAWLLGQEPHDLEQAYRSLRPLLIRGLGLRPEVIAP